MRTALGNLEEPVGFTIRPRQSIRQPPEKLADVEFDDDVALIIIIIINNDAIYSI